MKLTRIQALLAFTIAISACLYFADGSLGVSSEQINSEYNIYGASNPFSIIFSIIILVLIFQYQTPSKGIQKSKRVILFKRIVAFYVDIFTALLACIPLLSLPILIVEYSYTGKFEWSFTREFARASDTPIAIISALLGMLWLLFYYCYALAKNKPTVGQYLLGYKIETDIQSNRNIKSATWHMCKCFLVISAWPITLLLAFIHPQKQLFHEDKNTFYASLIEYKKEKNS